MKICLIQTDPLGRRENVQLLGNIIRDVQADLYVAPELFITGFDYLAEPKNWPAHAEVIPDGLTCTAILGILKGRSAAAICGLLEKDGQDFYNAAAVIGSGTVEQYRQKYPATTTKGRVLPILPGDYRKISVCIADDLPWSMGLMVCHDHYRADEFFAEYKQRKANAVVLIADSSTRVWLKDFPHYCRDYGLTAIVCNAAGPNGGGSCIINPAGEFIPLQIGLELRNYSDERVMAAVGTI
jgi:predicted amidohydrolase